MGDFEGDLEVEFEGDYKGDFRGDSKQDLEGDLLLSSGQLKFGSALSSYLFLLSLTLK